MTKARKQMARPIRPYRITRVDQTYHIGDNDLPTHLITQETVVALEPVTALEYVFDTKYADVQGVSGCQASTVRVDRYDARYLAVDLTLDAPLARGEEVTIEYHTFFNYPTPPPHELQQSSGSHGADHVELTVRFAPGARPKRIWWEERDGLEADSPVINRSSVQTSTADPDDPSAGFVASHTWTDLLPGRMVVLYWIAG
jgi:hypothetical protein